jgi:hypothetical protein
MFHGVVTWISGLMNMVMNFFKYEEFLHCATLGLSEKILYFDSLVS